MNKSPYEYLAETQLESKRRKLSGRMSDICNLLSKQHAPTEAEQQATLAMMYAAYLKLKDHNVFGDVVGHLCTEICRLILNGSIVVGSEGLSVRGEKELTEAKDILLELCGTKNQSPSLNTSKTIEDFLEAIKKSKEPNANKTTRNQTEIGRIQYRDIPASQNAGSASENDTICVGFCELGSGSDPGESSSSDGQHGPIGGMDPCGVTPIV